MRKLLLTAVVILICFCSANAQKKQPLTESSVVKDSLGAIVPYNIWSSLLITGRYKMKLMQKIIWSLSFIAFLMKNMRRLLEQCQSQKEVIFS